MSMEVADVRGIEESGLSGWKIWGHRSQPTIGGWHLPAEVGNLGHFNHWISD